jgi:DNA-binding NarL/FixJ family response regulator
LYETRSWSQPAHVLNGSAMSIEVSVLDTLTAREVDVMQCVVRGHSNRQIACELRVAEHTVEKHLSNIFRKLNVASRMQAMRVWLADSSHTGNPL